MLSLLNFEMAQHRQYHYITPSETLKRTFESTGESVHMCSNSECPDSRVYNKLTCDGGVTGPLGTP